MACAMNKNSQIQERRAYREKALRERLQQGDILTVDRGGCAEELRFDRWNGPYLSSTCLDRPRMSQDGYIDHAVSPLEVTHVNAIPVTAW